MRIVGGRLRGRALLSPSTGAIRPTSDRLREAIFNVLAHAYDDVVEGARVMDLYAGTGALGLEALSRGAKFALFVDDGTEARALIRGNVEALGLGGETRILRRDATKLGPIPPQERFTLAFLDPPYGQDLAPPCLTSLQEGGWLAPGALVVVEDETRVEIAPPEGWCLLERRVYTDTAFTFLRASD